MVKNKAVYLALGMEEIVAKIVPYKSLFDSTGGGATFSGGEPILFMIILRTLLIPGLTDSEDNMCGPLGFYRGNGISQAALAKNNPIWFVKSEKIGVNLHILHDSPIRGLYDYAKFEAIKRRFEGRGVEIPES